MPDEPAASDVREIILKHARLQLEYKGEYTGMREMRKHVAWYTAGMPHSASVRRKVNEIETYEQLETCEYVLSFGLRLRRTSCGHGYLSCRHPQRSVKLTVNCN